MLRDTQRVGWLQGALKQAQLDCLVCALPAYVLMTTGYWPVVGTSIALTNSDGRQIVIAPADEKELAKAGWADVWTYNPSSLDNLRSVADAAAKPVEDALRQLGVEHGRIGFERGPASEPASYVAMHLFGGAILSLIHTAAPSATLAPVDDLLAALAMHKTPGEISKIRVACHIAEQAFIAGSESLAAGLTETEVAARFRAPLSVSGTGYHGVARADGFAFCMSGPNSAQAYGAYARSRERTVEVGDLALIHCNSYADGYWTDITRTYFVGEPDDRTLSIYEAVLAARNAALRMIQPGVRAREVDQAAREKLARRGFEKHFKHSTGHGVGFAAISANARPRLHPKSDEFLEPGMVFNVEPAVYIEGFGGIRHCDVVAVSESGVEVLTPFHATPDDLLITGEKLAQRQRRAA